MPAEINRLTSCSKRDSIHILVDAFLVTVLFWYLAVVLVQLREDSIIRHVQTRVAEDGIRDHHNKNEGKNHFQNIMLHIAGGGEVEDVTRILETWRKSVRESLTIPFVDGPIW